VTATFAIGGAMAGVAAALYLMRFEETNYFVGFPARYQGVHGGGARRDRATCAAHWSAASSSG